MAKAAVMVVRCCAIFRSSSRPGTSSRLFWWSWDAPAPAIALRVPASPKSEPASGESLRKLIVTRAPDIEYKFVRFSELLFHQQDSRRIDQAIGVGEPIERHNDSKSIVDETIDDLRFAQCLHRRVAIGA